MTVRELENHRIFFAKPVYGMKKQAIFSFY
jgi:hypothetical protein